MIVSEIYRKITSAKFKMNAYARAYFDNFGDAQARFGEEGVRAQILYFFCNVRAMTPEQKQVKKELLDWANGGN